MRSKINGTAMQYSVSGPAKAPWLILLHGFPFNQESWKGQAEALKSSYRVLTYDLRGMGKSDLGKSGQPLEAYVDDLFALMKHLKIKQAVLGGLSMGGYIALRAIQRDPKPFKALALFDTKTDADTDEGRIKRAAAIKAVQSKGVKAFAKGMLPNLIVSKGTTAAALLKIMQGTKEAGCVNALLAMQGRTDTSAVLSQIKVPVLIIVGDQDKLTPPAVATAMAAQIKQVRLVSLMGAGHVSNLDSPEDFNSVLIDFLKDCS